MERINGMMIGEILILSRMEFKLSEIELRLKRDSHARCINYGVSA